MSEPDTQPSSFRLEEATIADLHAAIRSGATTCTEVVQAYLARVRVYNGVASMLVTRDGAPVPECPGAMRGTERLRFPTRTIAASDVLPDLDRYKGRRSNSDGWSRPHPIPRSFSSSAWS